MNTSIDISKSDIREIIELNFFNDLDVLDIPNSTKVIIEEDKNIVKIESSEEVKDIKVEDLQDIELSENIAGSSDLIEIVKHEINVDDQDNTSNVEEHQEEENVLSNEVNDKENSEEGELILSNVSLEEALRFFTS